MKPEHEQPLDQSIKFVYVGVDGALIEFDPVTGEGEPIEAECRDQVLISSSEVMEDRPECGVVRAYKGGDGHWHFDGYLTRAERLSLLLFRDSSERAAHLKVKP